MKISQKFSQRFSKGRFLTLGFSSLAFAGLVFGCMSVQNQPSLEAIQKLASQDGAAYVEAFVEYRGPQEKWAGPATFLVHVTAKDAGIARVVVTPTLAEAPKEEAPMQPMHKDDRDGMTSVRTPASAGGMTAEAARERMSSLATALQGADEEYSGCLSPVRVRLIRADGAVTEKQGCRGQMGWPKAASEAVAQFISAAK